MDFPSKNQPKPHIVTEASVVTPWTFQRFQVASAFKKANHWKTREIKKPRKMIAVIFLCLAARVEDLMPGPAVHGRALPGTVP